MEKLIKVTLEKYRFNINNKSELLKYNEMVKVATDLGHDRNQTLSVQVKSGWLDSLPIKQTIETDFLFSDQFNTVEGFRIYLWSEIIYPNRDIKEGYYLTGDIDELLAAQKNQLSCGYCGKRHDAREIDYKFCKDCLHSEYLTQDCLHLLRLMPVDKFNPKRPKEITKELQAEFNNRAHQMYLNNRKRLKLKAQKLLQDDAVKRESDRYETELQAALMFGGLEVGNLIYYNHTKKWVYGWRDRVSKDEYNDYMLKASELELPLDSDGIEFVNVLHGKFHD
jgi:hypothetical protein